jgi:hypothetical protein
MSEIIIPRTDIETEGWQYGSVMLSFIQRHQLPDWLTQNPDHLMVKSADASDFGKRVKDLYSFTPEVTFLELDFRFIAAAKLMIPLALSDNRKVPRVQIMEAKVGDYIGPEYAVFFHKDFHYVRAQLEHNKVDAVERSDHMHRWWNIRISNAGQELRITDTPLAQIIDFEVQEGIARPLPKAA